VQDDLDPVLTEEALEERAVGDVARVRDRAVAERAELAPIEDDDAMARGDELADAEATDVPGAAGDEDVQEASGVQRPVAPCGAPAGLPY
jgi:hypothetical protein